MITYQAPLKDISFVLNQVLGFPAHYQQFQEGEQASPDIVAAILEGASKFSADILAPLNAAADIDGCRLVEGQVQVPAGFKEAYQQFVDDGWMSLGHPESYGGQGLPKSLNMAVHEMVVSANHAWTMYVNLTWGAVTTLMHHGSETLKQQYLPKMVEGRWSGTMCLTEAHCGSDLGLLRTKAEPRDDGSYSLTGSKIFISSGEHGMTDNIIHLVLARLPDAPAGSKGISLFLVPKFNLNAQGNPAEINKVSCGSLEEKMGIHGNATCVMNFDGAQGFLIGEANKGLSCMFTFINESRLEVAQQANGHIEAAYQQSLDYARERLQMRAAVRKDPAKAADPIIQHADVRRMLLTQKALAEGNRMLSYYCAKQVDLEHSENPGVRKQAQTLLALLTPIAKGFVTETSLESTSHAIQILGGHGYVKEWGVEQHYRDTRITAIYEGTNGIQGLDLLGRKVLASQGAILEPLIEEILGFCSTADSNPNTEAVTGLVEQWRSLTQELGRKASGKADEVNSAAWDYMMFSGYLVVAYLWLKSDVVAKKEIEDESNLSEFSHAKLHTSKFYFERLLPRAQAHASALQTGADNLMSLPKDSFWF
ncbi:acyl-CoA dehydrogenase C-terminal domain-containing protein [Endozoicomonas arenosclerae]|uniref:acyl-CoA dehydrogenase C-terminal domain-containing protein n=1 Tax=Endozoicomonas arenosclerae TaxID=1633495 RepID=UPI000783160D|nr:acyl-CoA dehydrogenase C-terminal domain-containing protein [Endozoicomonas arenosclerae]